MVTNKMKWGVKHSRILVEVICLLYIILFVYAAISKLLDFESFRIQLGQSPILTAHADWVAWTVPLSELVVAGMLFVPRLRFWGLCASLFLMYMFTTYIVIILNFTDFIPCSCGGVLETMGWTEHLVFNLFFVTLGTIGILIQSKITTTMEYNGIPGGRILFIKYFIERPWMTTGLMSMASISLLTLLFLISEERFHTNNSFVRRFPGKPAQKLNQLDLGLNSYYLAGAGNGKIFLGNSTAPLHVVILDTLFQEKQVVQIKLDRDSLQRRSTQLKVLPPYFFILNGSAPFVFRGQVSNWKGKEVAGQGFFFSMAQPMDSNRLAIRGVSTVTSSNVLGTVSLSENHKVTLSHKLLQKQTDGIFDTDGILLHNPQLKKLVYTYFYRNEFIIANENLELDHRGKTIDTINQVNIKVANITSKKLRKLSAPPYW